MTKINKKIVGCEEWCAFPTIGLPAVKARVDSGAKTSALHAFNIQQFSKNKHKWISFEVHPIQNNRKVVVRCEAKILDRRNVKSSNGTVEKRYVIKVPMQLADESWDIEVTLSNRDSMGYRMLLGREAMEGRMLVDPAESFCCGSVTESDLNKFYGDIKYERSGLKIGLLASNSDLYSNKRIIEAGEERGHEMLFLNISQCYMRLDAEEPEVHHRGGNIVEDVDAIIPRIRPSITFYGCALTRHFESMDVFTLNSAEAISQSRDKLYALQLLLKNGLDIPTTGFVIPHWIPPI